MAKKSAKEKLVCDKKKPKLVDLEYDFGGLRAGQKMFVGTPQIVDKYIRKIPFGETRTIHGMRNELARRHKCDGTCPLSTAIFVRMSAEAALEDLAEGKNIEEISPFWRIITSVDKVTKKLDVDGDWIDHQRAMEV